MEDEASTSLDGKVLGNLRVVDLKQELEKRGLSKSGSKKDLVKRLKQQLEFEKLCEERKSSGDFDRKLELDAAIEQNEFVQQYLAQQQKRYAERKEKEKLELEARQKQHEEKEAYSSENEVSIDKDPVTDSDEDADEESSQNNNEPSNEEKQNGKENAADELETKVLSPDSNKCAETSESQDEDSKCPTPPTVPQDVNIEPKSPETKDTEDAEKNQNNSPSSTDVTGKENDFNQSPLSSPTDEKRKLETPENSYVLEKGIDESDNAFVSSTSDNAVEQSDNATRVDIKSPDDKETVIFPHDVSDSKDNDETTCVPQSSDIKEHSKLPSQINILDSSEKNKTNTSSCLASLDEDSSSKKLSTKDSMANMESSECSSVPYSLSDIQLPESPGHHLKCKDRNDDENCNDKDTVPEKTVDHKVISDAKIQSNGVSAIDVSNSYEEEVSEKKKSNYSPDSSEKSKHMKISKDNRQSEDSSDVEPDKDNSQCKKESSKCGDVSSNTVIDSDGENTFKETENKEPKSSKHPQQSAESDNDKSSDSDRHKHSQLDSKHRLHDKHRKRNRGSRSQSSSSSSSNSSDSSPKRRHSKKSIVTIKNKNFVENDDQMSDKSCDGKSSKHKNDDSLSVSPSVPNTSKKRLKIKRDNVAIDVHSANIETAETTSNKSDENVTPVNSLSVPEKPSKQETTEIKLSFSELPYAPRKVSLSSRKLNRKSSEEKNNEPKSKRSKWESFAAGQKTSQTISISTDSLKNWFPDFKLLSEPSSTMDLEQDDQSLTAADDKSISLMHTDVSNEHDFGIRQESTSHMDTEDYEIQEPHFENSSEQGPISKIIFIQNLVRPFTLNQLKDLLKQNGRIIEENFWIDKIKSKCFVMYETEKEALKARNALNNTRWPSSNPKILSVEFSNEEEMEQHKKGNEPPPKPVIESPVAETAEVPETRLGHPLEEHKRKEKERRKERERSKQQLPVREWDKDKVMQDSPEREHNPKEEKSRSSDKKEKKESKKRPNEDTPAKLLDDLFQKTKNPPCIYWLPLTEEQAKQKEEAQRMRKLEREKRNQQLKEQEEAERRSRRARSNRRSREKENRKSSTRSRSPVTRRR